MITANIACHAVSMAYQGADFQRRKAIHVGANALQAALNFRMQGRRIFMPVDQVVNRCENKSRLMREGFFFQLPNAIHADVGRPHGCCDQAHLMHFVDGA